MSLPQSMLTPRGTEAERIAEAFCWLLAPSVISWLILFGAAIYCMRGKLDSPRFGHFRIVSGGIVLPTPALAGFLYLGLAVTLNIRSGEPKIRIRIRGEQFWWRVQYLPIERNAGFGTANERNELHLRKDARIAPEPLHSATTK